MSDISRKPLAPAVAVIGLGVFVMALPRTLAWLLGRIDAHDVQVCAFANDTHQPDPWEDS